MNKTLTLLIRDPEELIDCDVVQVTAPSSQINLDLSLLKLGKASTNLAIFLFASYPAGFYIEAFGADDYNDGVLYEKTISFLH